MPTSYTSIAVAKKSIKEGSVTPSDLVDVHVQKIKEENENLNVYLEIFDDIEEQVEESEKRIKEGVSRSLEGIPVALKDNITFERHRAGAASKILESYVAPYTATAAKRLRDAGAILIGRTNMDEFAMGSSTENSAYGPTHNPHDPERVPGGSSGGSAAAVASSMALGALGSDTGGSIRQPASLCGVVGMKPTYGAISRSGLIALGSSLDQIGPLTRTVEDAELLFDVMKGPDPLDSTSLSYKEVTPKETKTLGVPRHLIEQEGTDPDVLKRFNEVLENMKGEGYTIQEIELPSFEYSLPVYYIIMPAEASSNLARFDGVKYGLRVPGDDLLEEYLNTRQEGLGKEPRRRIILGTYVLSAGYYDAYYHKAVELRKLITGEADAALASLDAIVTPTSPTPAFKLGEKADNPLAMYMEDIFTVPADITGMPAISVPMGTVTRETQELPVGFQIMSLRGNERGMFKVAKAVEKL